MTPSEFGLAIQMARKCSNDFYQMLAESLNCFYRINSDKYTLRITGDNPREIIVEGPEVECEGVPGLRHCGWCKREMRNGNFEYRRILNNKL